MIKKAVVALFLLGITGAVLYQFRIDLLLVLVKYRAQNAYEVAAPREVQWQKGPSEASEPLDKRPPNVILIVADDLGYNDISTFGGGLDGGRIKTPAIDALAAEGATFMQSYSAASTCAPSRAAMMTGRYSTRTGFEFTPLLDGMGRMVSMIYNSLDNGLPPSYFDPEADAENPQYVDQGLPSEEMTLAEMLKAQGYYTAHIGKWHLGSTGDFVPNKQGFDDSLQLAGGLYLPEDHPDVVNAKLPFDPIDQFLWAQLTFASSFNSGVENRFEPDGYMTDYWTDEATKVIRANKNRPFFLYLAQWGVHTPLQASREDYEAVGDIKPHRKRVYAAMIRSIDRSVQKVMEALKEEGLDENTIVLFTSDNGGAGYLGIPEVNQPFRGWKITSFEGGLRVPFFVRWPQGIKAGSVVDKPVMHIDVMPTLAAAAGVAMPKDVIIDGRNVLPLLEDSTAWDRETLFWRNGHFQVVRHGDWKIQVNDRPVGGFKTWLFDLKNDPTEQVNLAEQHPDKVDELFALMKAHNEEARAPQFASTIQAPIMIDKALHQRFEPGDDYVYTPN